MRPHLLLTCDFPPIGGGMSRMMAEMARHYPAGGLLVSTGPQEGSERVDGDFPNRIDRVPIPAPRLHNLQGIMLWSRRVSGFARQLGVEFTWCGCTKPAGYPAKWMRERLGVPYGLIVYGQDLMILRQKARGSRLKRGAARMLVNSASVVVAISRWTRDLALEVYQELGVVARDDLVRMVPLGTDPGRFRPGLDTAGIRARYGLPEGRWLLTVARLVEHKGIDTGIRVLARLREIEPDLRYAVVGFGVEQAKFERLARELGVADRVHFLTEVPDADLPSLYNLPQIYLGVSRHMARQVEGFGISLVEASASGIPVIGGRSGGIPDAVRDGESGLLVDEEDPAVVADAVRRLLEDQGLAARLGGNGRRLAESYYNWSRVVSDLRGIAREFTPPAVP